MANIRAYSCSLLTALWLLRICTFLTRKVPAPPMAGSHFLLPNNPLSCGPVSPPRSWLCRICCYTLNERMPTLCEGSTCLHRVTRLVPSSHWPILFASTLDASLPNIMLRTTVLHRKKNTSRCLRPLFLVLRCTFSTRTSSSYSPSCFWQTQSTPIVLLLVSCDIHCTTSLSSLCLQYFPSCLAIFDDAYITLATALCRCSTAHRVPPPRQPARVLRASSLVTDIGPNWLLCRDRFSSVMEENGDGHETRTAKV